MHFNLQIFVFYRNKNTFLVGITYELIKTSNNKIHILNANTVIHYQQYQNELNF